MIKNRRTGSHRGRRNAWKITLLLTLVAGVSAYPLYRWQSHRNTLRLLADANTARTAGNTEEAVRAYRAYLQRASTDAEALQHYTDLLWNRLETAPDSVGETIRAFRRLLRLRPDDRETMRRLTQLHLAVRDFVSADELATRWAQLAPDQIDAVLMLAQARHGLGKNAETAQLLADAAIAKPDQPRLYPPLIELLTLHLGRPDEARQWLEKGLEINPQAYEIHLAASAYFDRRKNFNAAEEHLNEAIRLAGDVPRVLVAAAAFFVQHDRLTAGGTYLARAKELAPLDRSVLSTWSEFALKTGHPDELAAAANALTEQASEQEPELLIQAAAMQIRARRFDKADELLAKLSNLNADAIASALPLLRGARALFADDPYAALPFLERAVSLRPQDAWAAEMRALALSRAGAAEEAETAYRQVLTLSPNAHSAKVALARSAWKRGDCDQVRATLGGAASPPETTDQRSGIVQEEILRRVCDLELSNTGRSLPLDDPNGARWAEISTLVRRAAADPANADLVVRACKLLTAADRMSEIVASSLNEPTTDGAIAGAIGRAALADDLPDLAERIAVALTQRFPTAVEGHALRVALIASKGQLDDAVRFAEACPLTGEANGRVWQALAEALLGQRDYHNALTPLRRACERLPRDIGLHRALARHTLDLTEAEAAVSAIRTVEGDAGLHWRYERAAFLLRLTPTKASADEAAALLRECLDRRATWVASRLLLGLAEEIRGNDGEAADAYRKALAEQPPSAMNQTALRLVEVLKRLGHFEEADATLDRVAGATPAAQDVLRLQTQRYLRNRNLASAVEAAEQLLSLQSNDPAWANLTADLQLRAGNVQRAEQIAREQLETNPSSTPPLWSLARALIAQSRADEAERLVRTQAETQQNAQQFMLLAQLLVHLKKPNEAATAVNRALTLGPEDPRIHAAAADFWAARGDRDQQLSAAREAVRLRDEKPEESLVLARILADTDSSEQRAEAAAIVTRRLRANSGDVPALLLEARLASAAEPPDLQRAETSLDKILVLEPKSAAAHRFLAGLQFETGRPNKAFDTVTSGLNANPNDPDLLLAAAELHAHRGEYKPAIPLLRRALTQNPSLVGAKRLLVTAYQHTGQLDLAEQMFEPRNPAVALSPIDAVLLARILELKGNTSRAEELLRQTAIETDGPGEAFREYLYFLARRLDFEQVYTIAGDRRVQHPDDIASYLVAAEILAAHAGDDALAKTGVQWLKDVVEHHPTHSDDAGFRLALSYYQRGDLTQAEPLFVRAVERKPRSPGYVNALAWLYAADLNRPETALQLLDQFVTAAGRETAEMLDTHAAALHRLGRLEEAKGKLAQCILVAGQTQTLTAATYRLGRVLWDAGIKAEALMYLRDALNLQKRLGGLSDAEAATAKSLIDSEG